MPISTPKRPFRRYPRAGGSARCGAWTCACPACPARFISAAAITASVNGIIPPGWSHAPSNGSAPAGSKKRRGVSGWPLSLTRRAYGSETTPASTIAWSPPAKAGKGNNSLRSSSHLAGGALCNQLAILTGWEVLNLGQSNTGYGNDAGGSIGKSGYGSASRLAALAALPTLDLIIVLGSANDSAYSPMTVTTAANTYLNAIRAAHPDTPIVVAGVESGALEGFDRQSWMRSTRR